MVRASEKREGKKRYSTKRRKAVFNQDNVSDHVETPNNDSSLDKMCSSTALTKGDNTKTSVVVTSAWGDDNNDTADSKDVLPDHRQHQVTKDSKKDSACYSVSENNSEVDLTKFDDDNQNKKDKHEPNNEDKYLYGIQRSFTPQDIEKSVNRQLEFAQQDFAQSNIYPHEFTTNTPAMALANQIDSSLSSSDDMQLQSNRPPSQSESKSIDRQNVGHISVSEIVQEGLTTESDPNKSKSGNGETCSDYMKSEHNLERKPRSKVGSTESARGPRFKTRVRHGLVEPPDIPKIEIT